MAPVRGRAVGRALTLYSQAIDKANKRLKGSSALLKSRRTLFEQVRTFWFDRVGTWLALDFEGWELDHNVITEFGWASVRRGSGTDVRTAGHVVLKENRSYRNHQYVPDMQDVSGMRARTNGRPSCTPAEIRVRHDRGAPEGSAQAAAPGHVCGGAGARPAFHRLPRLLAGHQVRGLPSGTVAH
jgi:hypothetical protein